MSVGLASPFGRMWSRAVAMPSRRRRDDDDRIAAV
jgi:hypothetical protein